MGVCGRRRRRGYCAWQTGCAAEKLARKVGSSRLESYLIVSLDVMLLLLVPSPVAVELAIDVVMLESADVVDVLFASSSTNENCPL
jgi:hypothetical protein